ncbi:MAG: ankyrin repeat domain-containing protein [Planctomycetaceae bacterium]|nr:ankyrin repeat domain-containing protein [Planctomycetaceae bacterium]
MRRRRRKRHLKSFAQAEWMIRHGVGKRLFRWLRKKPALCARLDGFGLLHQAAWGKRYDVVAWLLRHGVHPDIGPTGNNSALIHAASENDVRLINLLLDAGADIEYCNFSLETPLGYACSWNAVDAVRVLCERGANLNGTEGWGHSHLWCVQCAIPRDETGKQRAIEQILLAHGAEVIEEPPKLPWP